MARFRGMMVFQHPEFAAMAGTINTESRLSSARRFATFAIAWERLWPLVLPVLGVIALFLIVSWFGIWPMLNEIVRWATLALFAVAGLAALTSLRHFKWPGNADIDTRVERISGLDHRPVTAQDDIRADISGSDDPFAKALWLEHRKRMAAGLGNLKSGTPSPEVAAKDPWALRAVVALLLFIAVFAGQGNLTGHLGDAFRSHAVAAVETARIDAWIKPPAYTNKPPLFLSRAGGTGSVVEGTVTVPEGSELVIRVLDLEEPGVEVITGSNRTDIPVFEPEKPEDGTEATPVAAKPKTPAKTASSIYKAELSQSGDIVLLSKGAEQLKWSFIVTPDQNPSIAFLDDPKPSTRGALEFSYEVEDDYGVATAKAEVKSLVAAAQDARPLVKAPDIPLSLPGRRKKKGSAKTSKDLSSHPWAGAEVAITLMAEDHAGQKATSETKKLKLPGRVFTKPLARAIVYERLRLALDANQARSVAEMLDVITTTHPEIFIPNISHYTALRVAYRHIRRATDDDDLRDGLELLWQIALAVEDGDLSLAERRLRDAQERLAEALERGASDEEIEKLMQELRQAMNEFMRQLAEQALKNPQNQQAQQQNQNMQTLRQQDIDRMMKQIEDLAKSGSKDAARELLRQLQEMMNNLQMAQPQQGQQNDQFSEQMNQLGEMMRKQQELMDQTFDMQRRQQQQQRQQGQQQQQQQQQGQRGQQQQQQGEQQQGQQGQGQKPMTPEEFAEAMKQLQEQQGQLQQQMKEMQEAMEGLGMNPGEKMNEAGEAMGQAEGNLGQGETGEATGNQGRALQAMREGAQQMMQQMQNQAGEQGQRGQRGQHGEQTRNDNDPLGRQSRSRGPQLGDDTKVPGEIDAQRAREILDAIRKRLGETARPRLELDYLDRLLPTR